MGLGYLRGKNLGAVTFTATPEGRREGGREGGREGRREGGREGGDHEYGGNREGKGTGQ
jgi:hypothetical protein